MVKLKHRKIIVWLKILKNFRFKEGAIKFESND